MFELSIALKYLVPKKRSLASALISLMSVAVISLVVWLVLVFLSVTAGIEKNWLDRLTTLHAPIRISPTPAYYQSYFYKIDTLASASNYTIKTIGEKRESPFSDPFSPEIDPEIPPYFPKKDLYDPVQEIFSALEGVQKEVSGLKFQDYEVSGALMRLTVKNSSSSLSQMTYLLSIPSENPRLRSLLIKSENGVQFADDQLVLPNTGSDIPAILPKTYLEGGAAIGDRGYFSYASLSAVSMQEQKLPFRVVGFYDPGVMSVGNKCILIPKEITREIYAATQTFSPDGTPTNGIFVWIPSLQDTNATAEKITKELEERGIASYWNVTTYENFEFAKDLLHQFRSDRTLLLIIAAIILIVACCNIISLLVLLVNDKKKEIAILQSMGASFKSIALIFGSCGAIMGAFSCCIGTLLALLTLRNLDSLIAFLSLLQGRSAFNPAFFGKSLPNTLSVEALVFVLIATPILSCLAGIIPAIKASRIQPAQILRGA